MRKIKRSLIRIPSYQKIPSIIQVEPTNYCNSRCICCSASKAHRHKGYMEFSLFQKIIDDASRLRVRKVDLFLHGEPFLHPEIFKMLTYIKTKGLILEIATNGDLLDKNKIKTLFENGLSEDDVIRFSILGFSQKVHENVQRGVNHERVLNNVNCFIAFKNSYEKKSPKLKIQYYVIPENEHEKEQFEKYWQNSAEILSIRSASKKFRAHSQLLSGLTPRDSYCWDFWNRMTIFWNGDVSMCCVDVDGNYVVGNLRESSIKEIWTSEKMRALKRLHRRKQFDKLPICSYCDF